MTDGSNPTITRVETSMAVLILGVIVSMLSYGAFANELLMWRGIAVSVSISLIAFLVYPEVRGIKSGDPVIVPILREIETPTHRESFIDNSMTIALEKGRKNQTIRVQLWDGTAGVVKLKKYGFYNYVEGILLDTEYPEGLKYSD